VVRLAILYKYYASYITFSWTKDSGRKADDKVHV